MASVELGQEDVVEGVDEVEGDTLVDSTEEELREDVLKIRMPKEEVLSKKR